MIGVGGAANATAAVVVGTDNKDKPLAQPEASSSEAAPPPPAKRNLPHQEWVNKKYNGDVVQIMVACLIGANFLTNIVEKEIDSQGDAYADGFGVFELFYNIAFTIELGVNMYAHWWCEFWSSTWNIFDVVVVTIGVVNTLKLPLPKAFSLLRMMRAFRVFRLFKRVQSLNKIIVAIAHAVPGVANAFLILAIVMSIFSILAVEFFKDVGEGCRKDLDNRAYFTLREFCMGNEYFGTFTKSLYTFFQVLTGESWSEMVARPVIWYYQEWYRCLGSGMFFIGFILISSFILANVVVAVLLDKMATVEEVPEVPEGSLSDEEKNAASKIGSIESTVMVLAKSSSGMQADLDRAKSDMADIKDQLKIIKQAVEGKYRRAAL